MGRSVVLKVGTQVRYSGGLVVPSVSFLPSVMPAFIQDTPDATNKYASLGWNSGGFFTTVGEVEARAVVLFNILHWNVRLGSALGGGQSIVYRFVVNGTPDATLNITVSTGQSSGSATGSLAIAADDLIAIEAVVTGAVTAVTRGAMIVVES